MPLAVIALLLAIPLGIHLFAATQARYLADDYCWPMWVAEHGFWGFQAEYYLTYTGRWGTTALVSLASYFGTGFAPVFASALLLGWLGAVAGLAYALTSRALFSLVGAEAVVLATLFAAPGDALEAVYWQSGIIAYFVPIVIATGAAALALRFNSPVIAALGAFFAMPFNESFMILVTASLAAVCLGFPRQRRFLFPALTGAVLGSLMCCWRLALSGANRSSSAIARWAS